MPKKAKKRKPMPKSDDDRSHRPHRGEEGRESRREEPWDNPAEHQEIENQRFQGGLQPTPELYARAREQWYRLPGSVVRPSMDPVVGNTGSGQQGPEGGQPGKKENER